MTKVDASKGSIDLYVDISEVQSIYQCTQKQTIGYDILAKSLYLLKMYLYPEIFASYLRLIFYKIYNIFFFVHL